jgi:3-methyladenine DNA glycosylase AlkC
MSSQRKGAIRMADIPPSILARLNKGEMEALTLAEVLAVDFSKLLQNSFPGLDKSLIKKMRLAQEEKMGWIARTRLAGTLLYEDLGAKGLKKTAHHASDQVRGWGAALIAELPGLDIEERLDLIRALADDPNPGTRETAWIMIRPHIAVDIKHSIKTLRPWVTSAQPNIRRFASEITRPRGVWCTHIPELRKDPKPGLLLLESLHADPSRYVQNSVANWLNDASKDNPAFVRNVCRAWARQSSAKETAYICKRAQRTLQKKD